MSDSLDKPFMNFRFFKKASKSGKFCPMAKIIIFCICQTEIIIDHNIWSYYQRWVENKVMGQFDGQCCFLEEQ
jgi:predicted glycosyltransferase involved in capsule biosynthesis